VPAAVLVRQCASWAGVTTYEGPTAAGASAMYCASSVADLRLTAALLAGAAETSTPTPTSALPLAGLRVACVSDRPLYNLDAACEDAVARSVAVAADVLKTKLGAEVTKIKAARLRGADAAEALAGYDLVVSPAYAVGPGSDACAAGTPTAVGDGFAAGLLVGRETLCLPCGMIATEDDGYGEVNDQAEREGLPVNMLLTALHPADSSSVVLRVGAEYEAITRWGSDLFAPGRPRLFVKEDMDDARESFGIYFVDSLLKYMGKKVASS
jgi:hypothetical protein